MKEALNKPGIFASGAITTYFCSLFQPSYIEDSCFENLDFYLR